jgi:outer membrane receptor protein involved in Fe transport
LLKFLKSQRRDKMNKRIAKTGSFFVLTWLVLSVFGICLAASEVCDLSGAVYDAQTGEPLPGVSIMVKGAKFGTYTDLDGRYKLINVEPGNYTLVFSVIGYERAEMADLEINPGESKKLDDILLSPEAIQMKGAEVTAKRVSHTEAALLRIQMKAPSISDGISAEQIAKSPDSDAASALKRMTGVTVVGGKYVYVRGMGERYSNTMLNGATLPSPEPKKRVVPMDIIPANLLENVVTTKTATPDQWASFSGGSVKLKTKEFPDKFTLKFSTSRGWDTETTGKTVYRVSGGDTDWMGTDDGTREIPDLIREATNNGWRGKGPYTDEDGVEHSAAELASGFQPSWDGLPKKAPLNQGYNLSVGSQTGFLGRPLGFIFSLTYSNSYKYRKEIQRFWNAPMTYSIRSDYLIERSTYSVSWGGIFNVNYKLHPYHKLLFNSTYTRNAEDEVRWLEGYYEQRMWMENRLKWTEQSLTHFRLNGEHELPSLLSSHLDWSASYGVADREEPDESTLLFCKDDPEDPDNMYVVTSQKSGGNRFWEESEDINYGFSLEWTKDFRQWSGMPSKFKIGWAVEKMDREDHMWFFDLKPSTPPENYWVDKNELKENRPSHVILNPTKSVDWAGAQSYNANKQITAGYILVDIPVLKRLRMITGLRIEDTDMKIIYNQVGYFELEDNVKKNHIDWLPSLNLTYTLRENMNLRFGASKTLTRPEYFELVEREDREIFETLKAFGNPDIKHTRVYNYDLRWEVYPRPGELLAVSLFYKRFKDPIENIFTIMGTLTMIPANMGNAYNYGLELEARKNLDIFWDRLSNFSVNGNLAFIESKVKVDETGTSSLEPTSLERPLMGQSPYVINLTFGYENQHGTNGRILFHRFGERIAYLEASGRPDIIEQPYSQLDLVLEQKFFDRFSVKFNAVNLLDSEVKYMQGEDKVYLSYLNQWIDPVWRQYKKGVSFSLGLSYSM